MQEQWEHRLARHKDELEWLFMELYNDRAALDALEAAARNCGHWTRIERKILTGTAAVLCRA